MLYLTGLDNATRRDLYKKLYKPGKEELYRSRCHSEHYKEVQKTISDYEFRRNEQLEDLMPEFEVRIKNYLMLYLDFPAQDFQKFLTETTDECIHENYKGVSADRINAKTSELYRLLDNFDIMPLPINLDQIINSFLQEDLLKDKKERKKAMGKIENEYQLPIENILSNPFGDTLYEVIRKRGLQYLKDLGYFVFDFATILDSVPDSNEPDCRRFGQFLFTKSDDCQKFTEAIGSQA